MELRQTLRNAYCKVCEKTIIKNTQKVIYFYTTSNRGANIHICTDCIQKAKDLIDKDNQ